MLYHLKDNRDRKSKDILSHYWNNRVILDYYENILRYYLNTAHFQFFPELSSI